MKYASSLEWLESLINRDKIGVGRSGDISLDPMRALARVLGDPQDLVPAVHITGTNGKGSTTRLLTSLALEMGLSTGTYTSPHLERINERIALDGAPCRDDQFAHAVELVASVAPLSGADITYFEALAGAAYALFADHPTQLNIVEVGLGGRWDATNVVDAEVAVVTYVGLDHLEYFGPTRSHVAAEKAGIVKPGRHLVLGETDPDLLAIFEEQQPGQMWLRGRDFDVTRNEVAVGGRVLDLRTPGGSYDDVFLPVHGRFQGDNACIALAAAEAFFGRPLDDDVVREGFAAATVPGRLEVVDRHPLLIIDGAHNAEGARAAMSSMLTDFATGDVFVVVGCTDGRDPAELLEALGPASPRTVVVTAPAWDRAVPPAKLGEIATGLGYDVEVVPRVPDAIDRVRSLATEEDTIVVTGSLYVVGEARAHIRTFADLDD